MSVAPGNNLDLYEIVSSLGVSTEGVHQIRAECWNEILETQSVVAEAACQAGNRLRRQHVQNRVSRLQPIW